MLGKKSTQYAEQHSEDTAPSPDVRDQQHSVPQDPWDSGILVRAKIVQWVHAKSVAKVIIPDEEAPQPAYWMVGSVFSGLLGLRTHMQPEVGSEVLVLRSEDKNENYIIGSFAHTTGDVGSMSDQDTETVDSTSAASAVNPTSGSDQRNDPTSRMDRVGGEFDIMNAQAVGMSFLQNLVRLRASELSMVECHLMDDLVRVISDNYQHVNAFGEYTIKNDGGRPTVVWRGSSKLYETEGRENPEDELGDPEDWLEDKARSRFQSYVGHLGNMVHMFVTEPQDALNKTAAGRFRTHVNEDGSFLLQSFGDIVFEKTFAIQVPAQKYLEEDPEGDELADLPYAPHAALQDWVPGDDEFFYEAYKLRDYARWLNNWYSLAQFHRSRKDYRVPSESENHSALSRDLNGDPERPNSGLEEAHNFYLDVYSTMRIFKDGSILLYDGYASSVHLGGGDVTVSAARNLRLEAAGDIMITSGRDIITKAYRHFDLVAATGGIVMRAKRWFRALAERAEATFESLATDDTLTAEGTGATHAVTVRAPFQNVRVLAFGTLVLSATREMILRATAVLARCFGFRMQSGTQETGDPPSSANPFFAASPAGTGVKSLRSEGLVDCEQVRVNSELPIQDNGGISGVMAPTDGIQDASDLYDQVYEQLDLSIELLQDEANFPRGGVEFFHHDEISDDTLPRSITQTALSEGAPLTLTTDYTTINFSEFDFTRGEGYPSPGPGGQEKVYEAENSGLHTPASTNEHLNGSPTNMVDKPWQFRRIDNT